MTDTSWNIETADYGTLTASGVHGERLPAISAGESITFSFFFGTELTNHADDYRDLKKFGRYTNDSTADTGVDIRGKPWYRETLHPESDFSSGLVKLVPGADVGNTSAWWAIITSTTDQTRYVGAGEVIEVELFVLAEGPVYNTRSDVENDLKAEL